MVYTHLLNPMKRSAIYTFALLIGGLLLLTPAAQAEEEDIAALTAEEIIAKHVEKNKIDSEIEFVRIDTIDGDGNVTRHSILFCTQKDEAGKHQYLIRVVLPKKYSGVGLLAREQADGEVERYFYLPALGKVKRVVGKGKSPNFLGSNFTYEDLMKEVPDRYDYTRLEDDVIDGVDCYVIRATLTESDPDTVPAYVYRDISIDKEHLNIQKVNFVPPGTEKPAKTLRAYDYNSVKVDGPTMRPLRAEMRDHETGSISVLTVLRSRFNEPIDPAYFTPEGLANWNDEQKKTILASLNTPPGQ